MESLLKSRKCSPVEDSLSESAAAKTLAEEKSVKDEDTKGIKDTKINGEEDESGINANVAIDNGDETSNDLGVAAIDNAGENTKDSDLNAIDSNDSGIKKNNAAHKNKPSSCLFVASLIFSKSDEELITSVHNHFKPYGAITSVKVLRDTHNRPYAFVQYTNDEDCQTAIKLGHHSILDGRQLRCEAAKVNRTLFINFNNNYDASSVKQALISFGSVESLLPANKFGAIKPHFQDSRFWFVKFTYRDDAIRAYANLSNNASFNVEWAKNIDYAPTAGGSTNSSTSNLNTRATTGANSSRSDKRNDVPGKIHGKFDNFSVFVGHLKPEVTEQDLKDRFSRHGNIKELKLIDRSHKLDKENQSEQDADKKPDNFAFIEYGEEISAARAVELENHSIFKDKTIHVQYKEFHNSRPGKSHNNFFNNNKYLYYNKSSNTPMNFIGQLPRHALLAPPPINSLKKANNMGRNFYNYDYQEYPYFYYMPTNNGNSHKKKNQNANDNLYMLESGARSENYYDFNFMDYSAYRPSPYKTGHRKISDKPEARSNNSSTRAKSDKTNYGETSSYSSTLESGTSQISGKSNNTSIASTKSGDYFYSNK